MATTVDLSHFRLHS